MAEIDPPAIDSYLFHLVGSKSETVMGRIAELSETQVRDWKSRKSTNALESASEDETDFVGATAPGAYAESAEVSAPRTMEDGIPVLVMLRDSAQVTLDASGFQQGVQIGNVVTGNASSQALRALSTRPQVLQIEVSRDGGADELDVSIPATKGTKVQVPPFDERGSDAIVAVIDSGFDVLHEAFLDDGGKSRILALWDQAATAGNPPMNAQNKPLYGALHTQDDINRYLSTGLPAHLRRDPKGHGTHVASIAAGRNTQPAGAFQGGMAPEADLILVISKIETPPDDPRSIGYSRAHVDALDFIDRTARDAGKPVVVNISQGMNAGAHDGSSLLEAAFDNFSVGGRVPGRVLVKSAGNSAVQDLHAHFQIGDAQLVELKWQSWNTPRPRDLVELWFTSCDEMSFELSAPNSAGTTETVSFAPGQTRVEGQFATGNFYSLSLDRYYRDNGDARLLISVEPGTATGISLGEWILQVRGVAIHSEGYVDAWIERPDGRTIQFVTHRSEDGSLTVPGTANSVISVAAIDRELQGMVMAFSSRGATRDGRRRPDLGAPGNEIVAADAGTSNGVATKKGSSMAAPHVAGAIALLMSKRAKLGQAQANANQIRAALNQSSQGFNGRWNAARGWGMLDVEALLSLF